jgi:hypothetical protein
VRSLIAVLTHLKNTDTAAGHDALLSAAIDRVWACYNGEPFAVDSTAITPDTVETAHTVLGEHSPTQQDAQTYREIHGTPHPNLPFTIGFDFVDTASRYRTGGLPSFRSWRAIYSTTERCSPSEPTTTRMRSRSAR